MIGGNELATKENGRSDFKFEPQPQSPDLLAPNRGLIDRRMGTTFPVTMMQTANYNKSLGRTGGVVHLDINEQDQIPENQELENREDVVRKSSAYFKVSTDAPNYVESILSAKFYSVTKPPNIEKVEKIPEYASAEEANEGEMLNYLSGMEGFQAKFFLFFSGLLAGIAVLHWYMLYFSSDTVTFLTMYAHIVKATEIFFHMFSYFCAIFALLMVFNNYSNYKKEVSQLSARSGAYKVHCVLYAVAVARIGFAHQNK